MKEESVRIHMYRIQNKNDIGKTVIKESNKRKFMVQP